MFRFGLAVRAIAIAAGLVLSAGQALAAGFAINEQSARAMGLGGAYTAVADTPAATFWNPAGLAAQDGLQLEAGVTMIAPTTRYRGEVPGLGVEGRLDTTSIHWIPNLHASYRIHDAVAAGLGVTFPYGLSAEWPQTVEVNGAQVAWWGRGIVQYIGLQTVFVTPTVAVKLHPRVLLGAGLSLIKGAVSLERAVVLSDSAQDDIHVQMSGDDWGVGATAGILVRALPDLLHLGVGYRSGASLSFTGQAAFTKNGSGADVPEELRARLVDGNVKAPLSLPHVVSFGVASFPLRGLVLCAALDLVTWSSYDQLAIEFVDNPDLSSAEPKDWSNTVTVRLGAEYRVLARLPLRLGFIWDQSPVPAATMGPELPDGDRYNVTAGVGYERWGFRLDLAYQYIATGETTAPAVAPLQGTYQASAHLAGMSLSYHHPGI